VEDVKGSGVQEKEFVPGKSSVNNHQFLKSSTVKQEDQTMKTHFNKVIIALVLLALATLNFRSSTAFAQGTAFTYQGQLSSLNGFANGSYNFTFALFATNSGGTAVAGPVTNNAVNVTNGLFTTLVDFGPGVFTGTSNWLEIAVETNGGSSFTNLAPRQQLAPVPYAIYAEGTSNLLGTLPVAQLPANVVTNNQQNVNLCGTFCGVGLNLQTVTSVSYLYYFSLAAQGSGGASVFGNALFNNNGPADGSALGWTYNPPTGTFICNQAGIYMVEYDAEVLTVIAAGSMTIRAFEANPPAGGAFIPGSQVSLDSGALPVNTYVPVSKSFLAFFQPGQMLNIQFASTVAGAVNLQNPAGVIGANQPSISLTIIRIQ
jgi:hypothetical protein